MFEPQQQIKKRLEKDTTLRIDMIFSNFPMPVISTSQNENVSVSSGRSSVWAMSNYDQSNVWQTVYSSPLKESTSMDKSVDPTLRKLSQKVMKKTWDNKEDEFWNTY
jgi:hypothetical protein